MAANWIRDKIRSSILPYSTKWYYPYRLSGSITWAFRIITSSIRVYPDFFIIGVGRGGTTSLEYYLSQHPNIAHASKKEVHFFDREFKKESSWYKANFITKLTKFYFNKIKKESILSCDATPTYIMHPDVPERIKQYLPNSKFIVFLRNPADRAFSQYNREVETKKEKLSFLDALKSEEERTRKEKTKYTDNEFFNSYYWGGINYLANGHYAKLLKRWFAIYPRDKFFILKTETFSKDPDKYINEIFRFLDLPDDHSIDFTRQNRGIEKKMSEEERQFLNVYFEKSNRELEELLGPNFIWK